jgi:SAM-dependent methyltransferase
LAAVDRVLGLVPARTAIEVGAGTGLATAVFAREELSIIAVEPDPDMAEALRRRRLPGVEVVVSKFETWPPPEDRFDLLFSAQAWHWVERETGYRKALDLLRPGGLIALIWNVQRDRYRQFEAVYRLHAPELLAEADARIMRRDSEAWLDDLNAFGFEDVALFAHGWSVDRSAAEVTALYSTFSDHILLDAPRREMLLSDLQDHIESEGDVARLDYRTQVFTGRAPLSSS